MMALRMSLKDMFKYLACRNLEFQFVLCWEFLFHLHPHTNTLAQHFGTVYYYNFHLVCTEEQRHLEEQCLSGREPVAYVLGMACTKLEGM